MKLPKVVKKIFKITGITVLILLIAAFLIPIFFKKQITDLVKKEINKSINAKVDFVDVSLSLFRHFPKMSIQIKELSVVGLNEFKNDTLISTKRFDASAGLFSVIKGEDMQVSGLYLEEPRIHALVLANGKTNWDIAKESEPSSPNSKDSSSSAFKMSLKKYEINNGYILYSDKSSDIYFEANNIDHEGSGDLTSDVFTLSTNTNIARANFTYSAIPYLVNTQTAITTDIQIDNKTSTYRFNTDAISLNNLKLSAEGFFQLATDSSYKMDIKFKSPTNQFKDILSLVPAIYKQDFDKIKTSGDVALNGFVKGTYSAQELPAYDVNLAIKNGSFQYPDLPKQVKNIQLSLHAFNPDGKLDNTVIDLSKGHLEMDNEPFDFRFLFKQPETAKYIDAAAKGKIDLAQVSQFVKLSSDTKLSGQVLADAFAKGTLNALQTQSGSFQAGGFFDIKNLFYSSKDFPQPLKNGNIKLQLENSGGIADNTTVNINSGHIEVGGDPIDFTLLLNHPMTSANFDGTARGHFTLANLAQFMTLENGTKLSGVLQADLKFAGNKTLIDKGDYDKIDINGTASVNNVSYVASDYPSGIKVSNAAASFNPSSINISNFSGSYLGSNFSGNGSLNNLISFALKDAPLSGSLNAAVDKMNLNDWMGTTSASSVSKTGGKEPAANEPFLVPANMSIQVHAKANNVIYDDVNYSNIDGDLFLNNETVTLKNVQAQALDGSIVVNGAYSTKENKTNPTIELNYSVKDVNVQKAFAAFNTVKMLMPIAKFLDGTLNSDLTISGNLTDGMMPDLKTLTGKGNLLLLHGVLKKFAPLEKLAGTLQISKLQSVTIKDIKNYIEFANGKVLIKPFTVKVEDIELQIGGLHGLDQSMEYNIAMKVPRKYLGNAGNSLVNNLAAQANSKGIPIQLGEMVDLNVKMGGSLNNPALKVDLAKVAGSALNNIKDQAKEFAQQKVDSAKQQAKTVINDVKEQAKEQVKDKLKETLFGKDTTKRSTDSTAKPKINVKQTIQGLFKKPKQENPPQNP